MISSLLSAVASSYAQQRSLDVAANNLANINTTGFKQTGSVSLNKDFSQGALSATESSLDVAIQQDGFFVVLLRDGSVGYTRDGNFKLDDQGRVVNSNGYVVNPIITVPQDAKSININSRGEVSVVSGGSSSPVTVGRLQIARFNNPGGLSSYGNNIFSESASSGAPMLGVPGSAGFGVVLPGFLEMSNVDVGSQVVSIMIAQRAYEVSLKVARTANEMLGTLLNLKG